MGDNVLAPTHFRNPAGTCKKCGNMVQTWIGVGSIFGTIVCLVVSISPPCGCGCSLPCAIKFCWTTLCLCRKRFWRKFCSCKCMKVLVKCLCGYRACKCTRPKIPNHTGEQKKGLLWHMRSKIKIILGFYQMMIALTNTMKYQWPDFTVQFLAIIRLFTFDIMVIPFVPCLARSDFINVFFLTILGPPVVIAMLILAYF